MAEYLRPGVYNERVDSARGNRLLIRSDVAAFIGIAEKGPLDLPLAVDSFRQFQAHFGGFIGAGYLAYSVRAFFENGGRRCWVVRIASRDLGQAGSLGLGAQAANIVITDGSQAIWSIQASSAGTWGNRLSVSMLAETHADSTIVSVDSAGNYVGVLSTAGISRGTLVNIQQEDSAGTLQSFRRVVSSVDEQHSRLYWVDPENGNRLPYAQTLTQLDANKPARFHTISYRINVFDTGRLIASYSNLSIIPEHKNYGPFVLPGYSFTQHEQIPANEGRKNTPAPITITPLQENIFTIPNELAFESLVHIPLTQGRDGLAALSHLDFIGQEFDVNDSDLLRIQKIRGIAALNLVDAITLVAIPDIVIQPMPEPSFETPNPPKINPCLSCPAPPDASVMFNPPINELEIPPIFTDAQIHQVQAALIAHCESRGDRFAVIDPPLHIAENATSGVADIRAWRNRFDTSYAAIYYPWIKVIEPRAHKSGAKQDIVRAIPPSGHALGQYAFYDNETGVHRAPANRALNWCQDLTLHTTAGQQEIFNPLAINVIRSEGPRGLRIMGARTLSSDPDWRYINVRRLIIMIRRTLNIISEWVVFEPNTSITRNKLQVAISSYLSRLLQRGALAGQTDEQSFFVKCDEDNNPGYQRNNGQLLAEVGVAPSKPFEFIVLRVGVQENELEINESREVASAA